jgi:hypothetical protein
LGLEAAWGFCFCCFIRSESEVYASCEFELVERGESNDPARCDLG